MADIEKNVQERLEFSVKISANDMAYFMLRHTYTSYSGIIGVIISLGALGLLCLGYGNGDKFRTGALILIACLFTVVNPFLLWFKAFQQVKLTPAFQEPLCYTFEEDAIRITQGELADALGWENVWKVIHGKKRIILYVSKARGFIFPKEQLGDKLPQILAFLKKKTEKKQWKGSYPV